jgi:hypothetical protein
LDRAQAKVANAAFVPVFILAIVCIVALILLVETTVPHLLLQRWSALAAWIFTGLSLYSLLWLTGDYYAIRSRISFVWKIEKNCCKKQQRKKNSFYVKEKAMNPSASTSQQNYSLLAGVALIVIGGIFLLRNFDVLDIGHNWWALFMLIPISYTLSSAWRRRKESGGKFPPEARGALIGGAVLALVMCIFCSI